MLTLNDQERNIVLVVWYLSEIGFAKALKYTLCSIRSFAVFDVKKGKREVINVVVRFMQTLLLYRRDNLVSKDVLTV